MNKFVIVAVAFAVVAVSAQGPGGPKGPEFKKYMDECKAEVGASDDDLKGMKQHQPPTDKGWCVIGCMQKKSGAMGADNKINLEKLEQEMAGFKAHDSEKFEKMMANTKACKTEVEANASNLASPCSAAKAYGECVHNKM